MSILDVVDGIKVYLVEIEAFDTTSNEEVTLYYSTITFITSPTDTPANTIYVARVTTALDFDRNMYSPQGIGGVTNAGLGSIALSNVDGALDSLHSDYLIIGRNVTVKYGLLGDDYDTFIPILSSIITKQDFSQTSLVLSLQDKQFLLDTEISTRKYTAVGGGGVETFNTSLHGTNTPVCYGTVFNITPRYTGIVQTGNMTNATWDPYFKSPDINLSVNNTVAICTNDDEYQTVYATIAPGTGKHYVEVLVEPATAFANRTKVGVASGAVSRPLVSYIGSTTDSWGWDADDAGLYNAGNDTGQLGIVWSNDGLVVIGIAIDADTGDVWFSQDGTFPGTQDPAAGTNPAITGLADAIFVGASSLDDSVKDHFTCQFDPAGQTYAAPAGFNDGLSVGVGVSELVYQVHDGPVKDIPNVYSNGLALDPGQYTKFLDLGLFQINIGSVSGATITADVVGYVTPLDDMAIVQNLGGDDSKPHSLVSNDVYARQVTGEGSIRVSDDGNRAVSGTYAAGGDTTYSAAWVYIKVNEVWEVEQNIYRKKTFNNEGIAVDISGDGNTIIVGANDVTGDAGSFGGGAHIYARNLTTGIWEDEQTLISATNAANDFDGKAVSISDDGNTAVLGAVLDGRSDTGAITIWNRTGTVWTEGQQFQGSSNTELGSSVVISGDGLTIAAGQYESTTTPSNAGRIRLYKNVSGTWSTDGLVDGTYLSSFVGIKIDAVALSTDGNTLVVGDYKADPDAIAEAGEVRVYHRTAGVWDLVTPDIIVASDKQTSDWFGESVSINGDGTRIVVGAPGATNPALDQNQGAVYAYSYSGGVWSEYGLAIHETNYFGQNMGASVDISADGTSIMAVGNTNPKEISYYNATPQGIPLTAQELLRELVLTKIPGIDVETDVDLDKFDALEDAYFEGQSLIWNSQVGFYVPQGGTLLSVLNLFSTTFGVYMGFNRSGVFDIGVFTPPDESASVVSITDEHITSIDRLSVSIPAYEHSAGHTKNYNVMSSESIATAVVTEDPDRYAFLVQDYRNVVADNHERGIRRADDVVEAIPPGSEALYWTIQDRFPSSEPKKRIDTIFTNEADALLETRRRWHLYNDVPNLNQRDRLSITLEVQPFELQLNDTVHVTYPRFGLEAGKYFRIVAFSESSQNNEMVIEVWG